MTISWSSFSNKVDFVNSNLLNRGLFALAYWTAIAEESIRKQSMSIPEIIEWINAKGERAPSNSNLLRYFANNENLIRSIRGHEQLHFAYYLSEAKRDFPFAFSDELEFDDSGFLLFHENDFSKSYIIAIIRVQYCCGNFWRQ